MNKKILIVGAGPSLEENIKDWDRLGEFPGEVFCTDGAIKKLLEHDIIPDYMGTLEDLDLSKYYVPDIVKEKGHLIEYCYISDRVIDSTRKAIEAAGIKYGVAAKCRGYITSNVGLFSWLVSHMILEYDETYLIGMDHCYPRGGGPPVDRDSELFQYGFQVLLNPLNDEEIILHPAFQLWSEEMNWYAEKYKNVKITNCTGRGALYNSCFIWKPIKDLKSWDEI